jgi:hypothetical protein
LRKGEQMNFKQWLTSTKEERQEVAQHGKIAQKLAAAKATAEARYEEAQQKKKGVTLEEQAQQKELEGKEEVY